jgi:hypothetical protein
MCFKDANEEIFDDNIGTDSSEQKTVMRMKEYNMKSSVYNWASSCSEIKTKTHGTNLLAMRNRSLFLQA